LGRKTLLQTQTEADWCVQHGTPNGLAEDIREVIDDDVRQMTEKLISKKQSLEQTSSEQAKEVL